jgi:hypothetical protein
MFRQEKARQNSLGQATVDQAERRLWLAFCGTNKAISWLFRKPPPLLEAVGSWPINIAGDGRHVLELQHMEFRHLSVASWL